MEILGKDIILMLDDVPIAFTISTSWSFEREKKLLTKTSAGYKIYKQGAKKFTLSNRGIFSYSEEWGFKALHNAFDNEIELLALLSPEASGLFAIQVPVKIYKISSVADVGGFASLILDFAPSGEPEVIQIEPTNELNASLNIIL